MNVAPAETSIRRLGLRQRWDRLRRSDALENLLEESALWTGFPFSGIDHTRKKRSRS